MSKAKKSSSAKKYFWRDMYIGVIPATTTELKRALAMVGATNLQLLDQQTMTQESFVNLLFLWASNLIDTRGARGLEEELRAPLAKLNELVAADLKKQAAIALESPPQTETPPDGFSTPEPNLETPTGKKKPRRKA